MFAVIILCRKMFSEEKWPWVANIGEIELILARMSEVTRKVVFTVSCFISQLPMQ